ncbi:hypothetical protein F7725_005486 [Dissostichus mawsoni]|uniref:Ubiquitin-activating enzyme E1 C-terminal domain-containing protein n=1 Tax=Dissostichus mawsoni TaxID=36200 RepID=A0A7J5YT75_DISMA|nr:hypothetical protein F7725_005486 [Dissostichus mawsoni]
MPLSSEEEREAIAQLEQAIATDNDDDRNGHVDFVTSASALRARMYAIEPADRLKTKRIAGKIIPAIATATAAVAGLVALELIKVVGGYDFESFKNCFFNLAIPVMVLTEPAPLKQTLIRDNIYFSIWDCWTIFGHEDFTLSEFMNAVREKYGMEPTMVVHGVKMLYVPVMPGHSKRLKLTMQKLIKPSVDRRYVDLTVSFAPEADGDDDLPGPPSDELIMQLQYKFPSKLMPQLMTSVLYTWMMSHAKAREYRSFVFHSLMKVLKRRLSLATSTMEKAPELLEPSDVFLKEEPRFRNNLNGGLLFRQGPTPGDPDAAEAPSLCCLHLTLIHCTLRAEEQRQTGKNVLFIWATVALASSATVQRHCAYTALARVAFRRETLTRSTSSLWTPKLSLVWNWDNSSSMLCQPRRLQKTVTIPEGMAMRQSVIALPVTDLARKPSWMPTSSATLFIDDESCSHRQKNWYQSMVVHSAYNGVI